MAYWLVKSEPYVFGFQHLVADGKARWDGVRNYAARNHLRAMAEGDLVLFYHSNEGLAVVGICKVTKTAYPDPTAESGDWSAVDMVPVKAFNKPVPLASIKNTPELSEMGLVRIGRLSVMPVTDAEFRKILEMGDTEI